MFFHGPGALRPLLRTTAGPALHILELVMHLPCRPDNRHYKMENTPVQKIKDDGKKKDSG
jgi:hypothetical protein